MFKEERETLCFKWENLGDIEWGRPNLGPQTAVAVYRLMQFTLRDAIIRHGDVKTAEKIFFDAGHSAGKAIYDNLLDKTDDFDFFVTQLQGIMKSLGIGILDLESSDHDALTFSITVAEDLDCSGLPVTDETVCTFDEGVLAGLFEAHFNKPFIARETDCWCTGDRVCRFEVKPVEFS